MFKTFFDEKKNIFNEKNSSGIADYKMERHGKVSAYFQDIRLLHLNDLTIKSVSFDQKSDYTMISHVFDVLEIRGSVNFQFPKHQKYPFLMELHHGVLNASRTGLYPHYDVNMKSTLTKVTGVDRFFDILKTYVEQYVVKIVLFRKIANSFRVGFAGTLEEDMCSKLKFIPNGLNKKDKISFKCVSNTSVIDFTEIDLRQLKDHLNNKTFDSVDYENRDDHFVTGFRFSFDQLRLTNDVTVNIINGSSHSATDVDYEINRIGINIGYDSKHNPKFHIGVGVEGLRIKAHNQLAKDVEYEISEKLPLCIAKGIEKKMKRSIGLFDKLGVPMSSEYSANIINF